MLSDDLKSSAAAWPTPASRDYRSANLKPYDERGGETKGEQLVNFVAHKWPTPTAQDADAAGGLTMIETGGRAHTLHTFATSSLRDQTTSDGPTSSLRHRGWHPPLVLKESRTPRLLSLRLNPYFVEWLMGWPTGWTSALVRPDSSVRETELWRCVLQRRLSSWLSAPASSTEGGQ
jgi:hypothetical protein